jgi:HK97 family phage prohead protease
MDGKLLRGFEVKSEDRGEVVAIFSTFNRRDSDGDVTLPGAFRDGAEVVISAYGHKTWEGRLPVGRGTIRTSGTEARLHGRFFLDTTDGRDSFTVVKHLGKLGQWSYGYDVVDHEYGEFEGKRVRFLKRLQVHEVSPVLVGAGVGVTTVAAKSARRLSPADRSDLERIHLRLIRDKNAAAVADMRARKASDRAVSVDYSRDLDWAVPSTTRGTARAAVEAYAPMLGLDPEGVSVKWFSEEDDPEFVEFSSSDRLLGMCRPKAGDRAVWLRSDLTDYDAWAVACHELRHLAGGDEGEATVFEMKARMDWRNR